VLSTGQGALGVTRRHARVFQRSYKSHQLAGLFFHPAIQTPAKDFLQNAIVSVDALLAGSTFYHRIISYNCPLKQHATVHHVRLQARYASPKQHHLSLQLTDAMQTGVRSAFSSIRSLVSTLMPSIFSFIANAFASPCLQALLWTRS
jgi:hypothetical protein